MSKPHIVISISNLPSIILKEVYYRLCSCIRSCDYINKSPSDDMVIFKSEKYDHITPSHITYMKENESILALIGEPELMPLVYDSLLITDLIWSNDGVIIINMIDVDVDFESNLFKKLYEIPSISVNTTYVELEYKRLYKTIIIN